MQLQRLCDGKWRPGSMPSRCVAEAWSGRRTMTPKSEQYREASAGVFWALLAKGGQNCVHALGSTWLMASQSGPACLHSWQLGSDFGVQKEEEGGGLQQRRFLLDICVAADHLSGPLDPHVSIPGSEVCVSSKDYTAIQGPASFCAFQIQVCYVPPV